MFYNCSLSAIPFYNKLFLTVNNKLQLFNEAVKIHLNFSRHLLSSQVMSDYTTVVGYFDEDYKSDDKFTVSIFV